MLRLHPVCDTTSSLLHSEQRGLPSAQVWDASAICLSGGEGFIHPLSPVAASPWLDDSAALWRFEGTDSGSLASTLWIHCVFIFNLIRHVGEGSAATSLVTATLEGAVTWHRLQPVSLTSCSCCSGHFVDKTPNSEVRRYVVTCLGQSVAYAGIVLYSKLVGFWPFKNLNAC